MNKKIITLILVLCLIPLQAFSTVIFSDDFEITAATWSGQTDNISGINSETGFSWETIWPTQTSTRNGAISEDYGYSGKGFRFALDSSGGSTQESCMFSNGSAMSQSTLYWGFRFKMSTTNWGTGGKTLKMTRLYAGGSSIIPGLSGDNHTFGVFPFGEGGGYLSTGHSITDTDWHSYVFQFTAGTSNDGIIRLWVDGALEFEVTNIDYSASTLDYDYFPMMQGNLSGDYNGGTLYTYWDNFIWATTKAEVDTFLGTSAATSISGCTLSGASMQ